MMSDLDDIFSNEHFRALLKDLVADIPKSDVHKHVVKNCSFDMSPPEDLMEVYRDLIDATKLNMQLLDTLAAKLPVMKFDTAIRLDGVHGAELSGCKIGG
jgi:hypothetical protein